MEAEHQLPVGSVKVQCSIETARGVLNAREIVAASPRVISLSFGAEDYTRSMGTSRSKSAQELQFARTYLPVVAAEAGISAIDTVWSALDDQEGFEAEVRNARALGFSGKSCIHPSQVPVVHRLYTPDEEEVAHARRVMEAMRAAEQAGRRRVHRGRQDGGRPGDRKGAPGPAPDRRGGVTDMEFVPNRIKRRIPTEVEGIGKLRPYLEPGKRRSKYITGQAPSAGQAGAQPAGRH